MSRYLVSTIETYRFDNETEAADFIKESKEDNSYFLSKHLTEYKERKQKGEVFDSYYKVTLTKNFNDIKEPNTYITIDYVIK